MMVSIGIIKGLDLIGVVRIVEILGLIEGAVLLV